MSNTAGFKTERMQINTWAECLNDAHQRQKLIAELAAVLTPPVLRHLPEPLQLSDGQQAIDDWISARAAESDVMTIRDQANSDLLGLLILAEFSDPDAVTTVHLGYLFAETAWGKGCATELLSGLIDWYRARARPVQLLGGVELGNAASARVLQKNGFEKAADLSGATTDMFRLVL